MGNERQHALRYWRQNMLAIRWSMNTVLERWHGINERITVRPKRALTELNLNLRVIWRYSYFTKLGNFLESAMLSILSLRRQLRLLSYRFRFGGINSVLQILAGYILKWLIYKNICRHYAVLHWYVWLCIVDSELKVYVYVTEHDENFWPTWGYLIGEHGIYRERPKHNNVNFYFLIQ